MTDETRPDQDTPDAPDSLPEQTAEASATGWLPDLPDSAYDEDAVPLDPPTLTGSAHREDDLTDDEASLMVEDPDQPDPYEDGTAQEVQS